MAPYRDLLAIISLRTASSAFPPRVWRSMDAVTLSHGDVSVEVHLRRSAGHGCIKRERAWFACPSCGASVIAVGFTGEPGRPVGCRVCVRWRARSSPPNKHKSCL